jgi:PiT family inorganic phosphate transporter
MKDLSVARGPHCGYRQAGQRLRFDRQDAGRPGRQYPQRHVSRLGSDPLLIKDKEADLSASDISTLNAYKASLDNATKFIPGWVKIVVAIALGLGTMVGWKRIVVTVGSKIGKTHLTYAQGACAEITAAATIAAADVYGLPVSTTHVLSSGVAGTMAANGSGLQWATVRNIALAWVMTLPAAMALSGALYFLFSRLL